MTNPIIALDVHFYVSLVGKECDKGNGKRDYLKSKLLNNTGLSEVETNEFLDEMIKQKKLVDDGDGNFQCTIK